MSLIAFGIVLFSAALHAGWNAIIKGVGDTRLTTALVVIFAGALAALILPFLPQPAAPSWPFLAGSVLLQTTYYLLVAASYEAADMSQVYPLMRGVAPLLVATVGALALSEHLAVAGWAGIVLVCGGVLSLALLRRSGASRRGGGIALPNAVVIAAYTLVDGTGVRLSGTPAAYTLWLSLLTTPPFLLWVLLRQGPAFLAYARRHFWLGLAGGFASFAAYGLALWAMTEAPVAVVAALRETSILFGTVIAASVLREPIDGRRIAATLLIAAGAILLRLA